MSVKINLGSIPVVNMRLKIHTELSYLTTILMLIITHGYSCVVNVRRAHHCPTNGGLLFGQNCVRQCGCVPALFHRIFNTTLPQLNHIGSLHSNWHRSYTTRSDKTTEHKEITPLGVTRIMNINKEVTPLGVTRIINTNKLHHSYTTRSDKNNEHKQRSYTIRSNKNNEHKQRSSTNRSDKNNEPKEITPLGVTRIINIHI